MLHRILTTLAALGFCLCASAAPFITVAVRAEIDGLLTRLEKSSCEFQRNGSWYSGKEARKHLQRKLDYLIDKNMVQTTEQFIERGATGSSTSGKAYQVRCGSAAAQPSAQWLQQELKTLRTAPAGAPK